MTSGRDDPIAGALSSAVRGDEVAFARIVQAYHLDMTRVCFVICDDQDLADEAVQVAWSVAWRKLGTIHDPERLRGWLVSVAANEARQLLRRQRRRTVVEISAGAAAPPDGDPADRADDLDLAAAFARLGRGRSTARPLIRPCRHPQRAGARSDALGTLRQDPQSDFLCSPLSVERTRTEG